jgi:glutamine amidotransferase
MSGGGSQNGQGEKPPFRATVIDAGVGNLGNLARALRHEGAEVLVTDRPEEVARSSCLVLPGVGAFRPPREALRGALEEALRTALAGGAYLLGICVGFQLLFETSTEFGSTDGLGLIGGRIERLPGSVPLPHIGWNRLVFARNGDGAGSHPLLRGLDEGGYAYFVHSFAPVGVLEHDTLATCLHGRSFPAIVSRGRVLGTQFHPEKSGALGLRLLRNYLELAHGAAAGDRST